MSLVISSLCISNITSIISELNLLCQFHYMQLNCGNTEKLTYGLPVIEAPVELPNWWLSHWAYDDAYSSGVKRPWTFYHLLAHRLWQRGWIGGMSRMCASGLHNPGLLPRTNKTLLRFCSLSTSQPRERKYVTLSWNRNGIAKAFLLNHQNMQRWTLMYPFSSHHFFDWYMRKYFSLIPPSL